MKIKSGLHIGLDPECAQTVRPEPSPGQSPSRNLANNIPGIDIITLKNAIHNVVERSGATTDYCQGLIVGVVSGLMAHGLQFRHALALVAIAWPAAEYNPRLDCLPESWRADFAAELLACKPLNRQR